MVSTMHWEYELRHSEPGTDMGIPMVSGAQLIHAGYYESTGLPPFGVQHYRKALPDGRGIHVKIYRDHAVAHLDRVDPSVSLVGHLVQDAPGFTLGVGLALAAVLGSTSAR